MAAGSRLRARRYEDAAAAFSRMHNPPTAALLKLAACLAQLGRDRDAEQAMSEFLRRAAAEQPDFPGTEKAKWLAYCTTAFPLRRQADVEHWLEGLRKAGLPV